MADPTKYSIDAKLLALCHLSGVTPRVFETLFRHYGSIDEILKADAASLGEIDGMTTNDAERIGEASDRLDEAEKIVEELQGREIRIVHRFADTYPELLFELNDPPPLLFVRGRLPDPVKRTVGVVGSHEASQEGIEMATRLAKRFADDGIQVISSLRGGIDTAAHLGAASVEGVSFAVVDAGFDEIASTDEMPVAIDIAQRGGVISEYLPDKSPGSATLEASNRLIVGLSQAIVVTEMYGKSEHTRDLVAFCNDIGKLIFFMVDPEYGAFSDESALSYAVQQGAIPIKGYDHVDDIIKSLV